MLEKIIAAIALALFDWLEKRQASKAVDADVDRDRLRRAGSRIREWMQQNGVGSGRKSDEGGTKGRDEDIHTPK